MPDGCVAIHFEMLTYLKYAPLSNRIDALPSNMIWGFQATSSFVFNNKILNRMSEITMLDS
jgi:hypothetical protein